MNASHFSWKSLAIAGALATSVASPSHAQERPTSYSDETGIDETGVEDPPPELPPVCDDERLTGLVKEVRKQYEDAGATGWAVFASSRDPETQEVCVKYDADGFARGYGQGYAPYTIDTRQNVGSASKLFLAAALMQVLADQNLSEATEIGGYLPPTWRLGEGVAQLTFGEVMQHRTGFTQGLGGTTTAVVKQMLELGLPNTPKEVYSNNGYGLLQLLFGRLHAPDLFLPCDCLDTAGVACDTDPLTVAGEVFERYAIDHFFVPHGIGGTHVPSCAFEPENAFAYQDWDDEHAIGTWRQGAPYHERCGVGGMSFTPRQLWKAVELFHADRLIDPGLSKMMESEELGTNGGKNGIITPKGTRFFGKAGYLPIGTWAFAAWYAVFLDPEPISGRPVRDIVVASTSNSPIGGKDGMYTCLAAAYDAAFDN